MAIIKFQSTKSQSYSFSAQGWLHLNIEQKSPNHTGIMNHLPLSIQEWTIISSQELELQGLTYFHTLLTYLFCWWWLHLIYVVSYRKYSIWKNWAMQTLIRANIAHNYCHTFLQCTSRSDYVRTSHVLSLCNITFEAIRIYSFLGTKQSLFGVAQRLQYGRCLIFLPSAKK